MVVTLGLFFAADAMQVTLLSFLTVVLQKDWNLSDEKSALIASSFFAGSLVGNMFLGPLADSIGRRPVFLMVSLQLTVAGLLAACAPTFEVLILMIFMVGIGVGGLTIQFDILAEFVPSTGRGGSLLFINYFWTLGSLFVVVVAYMTLHGSDDSWRLFVAICPLPCIISLVAGYLYIPESARWLVTKGRNEEAMAILRMVAGKNGRDVDLVFPPHVTLAPEPHHKEANIADLFQPKWIRTILYLWCTWGFSAFGYYGTIMAITYVFAESSDKTSADGESSDTESGNYDFDFDPIFVSTAADLLGTTSAIAAVDRIGRIPSQAVSYALAGLSVGLLCILASSSTVPRLVLVALGLSARIFEMSGTCLTWVSTAEVLTTEVRGMGHSTSSAVGRIGSLFAPYLVVGRTPLYTLGIIMLLTHTFTVVCISQVPETKGRDMGAATDDGHAGEEHRELVEGEDDEEEVTGVSRGHLL
jgi:putative MFS transporter